MSSLVNKYHWLTTLKPGTIVPMADKDYWAHKNSLTCYWRCMRGYEAGHEEHLLFYSCVVYPSSTWDGEGGVEVIGDGDLGVLFQQTNSGGNNEVSTP